MMCSPAVNHDDNDEQNDEDDYGCTDSNHNVASDSFFISDLGYVLRDGIGERSCRLVLKQTRIMIALITKDVD